MERQGFAQVAFRLLGGDDRGAARRGGRVSALETRAVGRRLAEYLDAVEARLAALVEAHPGTVAAVGSTRSRPAASGSDRR